MTLARVDQLIERFCSLATPVPGIPASHQQGQGRPGPHLVISALVHGDEVGPLAGLVDALERLVDGRWRHPGPLTLFLGNPAAARAGRRFLDSDLNRVFLPQAGGSDREWTRSRALLPLLETADVYLDFHQTALALPHPFYTLPFGEEAGLWTRALQAAPVWVGRRPGSRFVSGSVRCTDEVVRDRGRVGITVEFSQRGFSDETEAAVLAAIERALGLAQLDRAGLAAAAEAAPALALYDTRARIPFDAVEKRLRPGLGNFQAVTEGELLSAEGTPELRAPCAGRLLFPKYVARDRDGRALPGHPRELGRVIAALTA